MVHIPEELARSIQAGDCVLWVGAGFGSLAGRPSWDKLLRRLVSACPEEAQHSLEELLEQGRLRTVMTYVHRHFGDEPLAKLLKDVSRESADASLRDGANRLARLPWKACFATTYPDVVQSVFAGDASVPEVLSHRTVHYLSLRDHEDFFILRTPPTGRSMRTDAVLFDLVEEVVRSRTILFMGFEPDDPDLAQILDLIDRIGRGNQHFAVLPLVSAPEAEEWNDRFGLRVLEVPDEPDLVKVFDDLLDACATVAVRPSDVAGRLAVLDLTRAVRGVAIRADLAIDEALTLDVQWVEHLVNALPGGSFLGVPAPTLLRTGGVLLAHNRIERARKCFQQVVASQLEGELTQYARFNLALTALAEDDRSAALVGFIACAEADRSLALVPPRFELKAVHGRVGTQLLLTCRDRSTQQEFDIEVSTMARPVGGEEQFAFTEGVQKLTAVEHDAVSRARGGFADGRLFGVMYEPTPGFVLADTLESGETLSLAKTWELAEPLIEGLVVCHARGVLHRNLNPQHVLLGPGGAMLRGFGFPPVVGYQRPSIRDVNFGYHAPEVRVHGEASPASDIYALAALLYRCLTGESPRGSVPPPTAVREDLDPRLDPLLQAALHPDPRKRIPLSELKKQLALVVRTPELGRAQRYAGESAEPGKERVVDLGSPRMAGPESAAAEATVGGGPTPVPASASSPLTVKLQLPDDPNDLEAWAWILERKPTHMVARENIERIEQQARQDARWDRVVEVLAIKRQYAQIHKERVELLREMVAIYEQELGAPASAFEALQTLMEEVELDEQIMSIGELERLAEVTGKWSELADSVHIVADRAVGAEQQAKLYAVLAEVYDEKLGATDRAVAAYEKAVEVQSDPRWLEALAVLYRKTGSFAELAATLLSLAEVQAGTERHTSLLAAAQILRDDLGDEEGAFAALEVVLAEDREHTEALELAESVARHIRRWDVLAEILGRRAEASLDDEEAARLRKEAASIAVEHLQDADAAIEYLEKSIRADRNDAASAAKLVELLRPRVQDDPACRLALIDALGVLIDATEGPRRKAALLVEAADLMDQEPDGRDRAVDCREQILTLLPPEHEICLATVEALEKTYRRQEDHRRLEALWLQQARAENGDGGLRAGAWHKLYALRKGPLDDGEGTLEALENLSEIEPTQTKWRDELLVRYLERGDYNKAGPLIRAQINDEQDPKRKAVLLLRGGLLRGQIGKTEGAMEALEEAVALDPTLTEGWMALRDLYREHEQPLKAVEALVSGAEHHAHRVEKTRMLFEAAKTYLNDLDRSERGVDLLEKVVELDPDHREATGMLLEQLVADHDLVRAFPHAQTYVMQVRSQAPNDHKFNLGALFLAGRCALAANEPEKAREYLEKAKSLDATNLDVLRLLAELDMDAGRWPEALRNYQSVVLGAADKVAPAELSALYVRMARARVGMGEKPKAVQMLERALDIDPDNEEALDSMITLAEEVGGAAAAAKAKGRLVELLERDEQRRATDEEGAAELRDRQVELLQEIAEAQISKLALPVDGIQTLERVLELRPNDPAVLHRLLDVLTAQMRWRDAVNVLEQLANAQKIDTLRAKYLWAGALLLRDHLDDHGTAKSWLKRMLEADPLDQRGFDAYTEGLERDRSWNDLSKAIRNHLKALPKDTPPERLAGLFERLGEAHEKLQDTKTAIAAYDQAARLGSRGSDRDATQIGRRMRVMKLGVGLGGDELEKAVHHGHAVIAANPMDFEVYHRLVEIYLKQGNRDRARAVARTLKFLKQADEGELELVGSGEALGQVRSSLSRDNWRREVYHPAEDPRLSDLFMIVWPMVAAREGRTHDHFGVERSHRTAVSLQSPQALARFVAHACQTLDAPVPDLFVLEDEAGGIHIDALAHGTDSKNTVYPTVIAGKDALKDVSETAMKFRAGRAVARVRPDHILSAVLRSSTSMRHVVYGALRLTDGDAEIPEDSRSASAAYAETFAPYLQPARLEQLRSLAAAVTSNGEVDTRAWARGVIFTTTRAGFISCDSLDVAAQILTREGDEGSLISAKERIADLIAYSVSEPYLKLRKAVGLSR